MWTNKRINEKLGNLRDHYRAGLYEITYAMELEIRIKELLDGDTINEQTQKRLNALFAIPTKRVSINMISYPSPTDTAKAIQNFMNRRLDPWAHTRPQPKPEVQAYATSE